MDTRQIFLELMTLGPYSTFGEIAALKGSPRAASVISNAVTELLVLTRCAIGQNTDIDLPMHLQARSAEQDRRIDSKETRGAWRCVSQ